MSALKRVSYPIYLKPARRGDWPRYVVVDDAVVRNPHLRGYRVHRGALRRPVGVIPGFWPALGAGVNPGSQTFSTPGTFTFTVPLYNSLTVTVNGAGGGGGGANLYYVVTYYYAPSGITYKGYRAAGPTTGGAGGNSSFNSTVIGDGGGGGVTGSGSDGTAGSASGGDTNTTGGGAAGGPKPSSGLEVAVSRPGGPGGRAVKTYALGALTVGAGISVVVGAGGTGGGGDNPGSNGSVVVTWV